MYKNVFTPLTRRHYSVAAVDLLGHGESASLGVFSFARSTELLHQPLQGLRSGRGGSGGPPRKIVIVGISLGGQAVLDLLAYHLDDVDAAIVSGVSIHPPDERHPWAMPRMPTDSEWLTVITEDLARFGGMPKAQELGQASFAFSFRPAEGVQLPPTLLVAGERDVPMALRDLPELAQIVEARSRGSERVVLKGAWHNHAIDVPAQYVDLVDDWVGRL